MAAPILTATSATFTRVAHVYENTNSTPIAFSLFNFAFDSGLGAYVPGATDDLTPTILIGIAITGVSGDVTGGLVEFSVDGGANWAVAATAPVGKAIVFKGDTLLRYTPPADANGTRTITFNAWDGTGGFNSGDIVDLAVTGTGGNTPFSSVSTTSDLIIDPNDGKVITNMGGNDFAIGMSVVTGDKVVVVGESFDQYALNPDQAKIAIARYNSDGSLDTTFSGDGKVILDITDANFTLTAVHSLQVDSSGNYLISGLAFNYSTGESAAVLARVDANGAFDTTFGGGDGYVLTTFTDVLAGTWLTEVAYSTVIQGDGSILSAGTYLNAAGDSEFALIRHTSAGVLDTSFNTTGSVITGFGAGISGSVSGVLVDANGNILVAGTKLVTGTTDTTETNVVVRYTSTGALDNGFGVGGIASFDIGLGNGKFNGFATLQDVSGKILLTGSTAVYDYSIVDPVTSQPHLVTPGNFVIARLNANGVQLDSTFGTNGILTTDLGGNDESYDVQVTQVLGIDKILVAGSSYGPDGAGLFVINRYNSDGSLDTGFSDDGKFEARFPESAEAYNFAVQADEKILISGVSYVNGGSDFALLRLNSDGTLDNSFTGENNAPLLDADGVPLVRVAAMFEGDVGSVVPFSYFNSGFIGNIFVNGATDPDGRDPSQLGIAIVDVRGTGTETTPGTADVTLGLVEFSTDDGQTWQTAATAPAGSAIVFSGTTLLRYTPPAGASGERTIEFHTWDGTGGFTEGQVVDITATGTGGTTPFSVNTATHSLQIIAATDGDGGPNVMSALAPVAPFYLGGYLQGLAGNDTLIGNIGNDKLVGGSGDDALNGGVGADRLLGGDDNDLLLDVDGTAGDVLDGGAGNDTASYITSSSFVIANLALGTALEGGVNSNTLISIENLIGSAGNDSLTGDAQANILNGGLGADTMQGGLGDDSYVFDNVGDVVTEAIGEGADLVTSVIDYTLTDNVENLTLGGTGNIAGTGNALNNVLRGNSGNNVLIGGAGNDTLIGNAGVDTMTGGLGDDSYVVTDAGDVVTEVLGEGADLVTSFIDYTITDNVENLTLGGTGNVAGTGNALGNIIRGNSGNNTLIGGAGNDLLVGDIGNDTMVGGLGNDSYVVADAGDIVTEALGEGIDFVTALVNYTMTDNVENLTLGGTGNITGTGNALANILRGNSGNNVLIGGAGNDLLIGEAGSDTLAGGLGDDAYVVADAGDVVTEALGEGIDLVSALVDFTLSDNVENLTLGGTGNIAGTGNVLANVLRGNSGDNVLTGGAGDDALVGYGGNDTMVGGLGNDSYVVADAGDVVTEALGEGTDLVSALINYTLTDNVENLTLNGTADLTGTGNALNNLLRGNSGNNTLTGGAGDDLLVGYAGNDTTIGGLGNDTFVVTEAGDIVIEALGEGADLTIALVNYTLTDNVENLTLDGAGNLAGTGNALNNVLRGNSGNNVLTGGAGDDVLIGNAGNDTMIGGLGNDSYVVTDAGDIVTEALGEGTDLISSMLSYTLSSNVENLTLGGTGNFDGTGNALNNVLRGNSGNNVLTGGNGKDVMVGGLGADTFDFNSISDSLTGSSRDVINDFSTAQLDKIDLSGIDAISSTAVTNDAFSYIGSSAFSNVAGQLRFAAGIVYGDVNGDGVSDFEIALAGVTSLTSTDFIL